VKHKTSLPARIIAEVDDLCCTKEYRTLKRWIKGKRVACEPEEEILDFTREILFELEKRLLAR